MPALRHLALVLALLCGCAASPPDADPGEVRAPDTASLAAIDTSRPADPAEQRARELLASGEHEAASEAYLELAKYAPEPAQRAEFTFLAAEAALAGEEFDLAYELFRSFLNRFPGSPRYPEAVERIFIIGRAYAEERATKPSWLLGISLTDRQFGVELLQAFQEAREQHPLADDALHYVAEAQLAMSEPMSAIATWERLAALYPRSEWVETAELRSAMAFGAMSQGPRYDKRPLLTSLVRLRAYAERYPTGSHIEEAREAIRALEESLGEQDLEVAAFYMRRGKEYAARTYLDGIIRRYPGTEAAAEAVRRRDRLPQTSPPPPPPEPSDEGFLRLGEPLIRRNERPEPVPID